MFFSLVVLVLGFMVRSTAFNAVGGEFLGFVAAAITFIVAGWVIYLGGGFLASATTGSLSDVQEQATIVRYLDDQTSTCDDLSKTIETKLTLLV